MKTEFETATTDLARRVPPHSVEAERAVLAGLILRPSAMGQIAPMLHPEDFYLPAHQTLYAAALGLHTDNRPVDLVTLAEHLRDQGSLEQAGGAAYIADLAQSHVSAANAEYYAKLVRDKSIQRGLIEAGAKIVSTGFDTSKDLAGLIDEAVDSVAVDALWVSFPADYNQHMVTAMEVAQRLELPVVTYGDEETWWTPCSSPQRGGSPGSLLAIPNSTPSHGGSSLRI